MAPASAAQSAPQAFRSNTVPTKQAPQPARLPAQSSTQPKPSGFTHRARQAARPSKNLEDAILQGRFSLNTVGHNMLRGGLPIIFSGKVIGGVGVSGAASADQDVLLAQAALGAQFVSTP